MFEVYAENRSLQFNAVDRTLYLVGKYKVSDVLQKYNNQYLATIDVSPRVNPVFAFYCENGDSPLGLCVDNVIHSSIKDTYIFRYSGNTNTVPSSAQQTYIYLFDLIPPNNLDTYGLQVYDASGQVVYNSNSKPLVVVHSSLTGTDGNQPVHPYINTSKSYNGYPSPYVDKYSQNYIWTLNNFDFSKGKYAGVLCSFRSLGYRSGDSGYSATEYIYASPKGIWITPNVPGRDTISGIGGGTLGNIVLVVDVTNY